MQRSDAFYERLAAKALNDTFAHSGEGTIQSILLRSCRRPVIITPVCGFDLTQRTALQLSSTPHLSAERCAYSLLHVCQDVINVTTCQPSSHCHVNRERQYLLTPPTAVLVGGR